MQKRTVFLLQETKELNDALIEEIKKDGYFEVVGWATDGISAISAIADKQPNVLITDLVLSGYDGFSVISKIKSLYTSVKVVVLTALSGDEVVSKAVAVGAECFMTKPYNNKVLIERMKGLFEQSQEGHTQSSTVAVKKTTLDEKISKIFINVGIPPHIKGYGFLREGVKMAVDDPALINNITKKLYPMIGERYKTTASKVERAIRHAIEVAWNRGRIETINSILGVRAYVGAEKPTNGEFIALVADKMLLEKD